MIDWRVGNGLSEVFIYSHYCESGSAERQPSSSFTFNKSLRRHETDENHNTRRAGEEMR